MNALFAERAFGIPWMVIALAALAVAVFYAFVPVDSAAEGMRWFILRWFHTVAWLFLAASAFVRAKVTRAPLETSAPLAATGGVFYVILMLTQTSAE